MLPNKQRSSVYAEQHIRLLGSSCVCMLPLQLLFVPHNMLSSNATGVKERRATQPVQSGDMKHDSRVCVRVFVRTYVCSQQWFVAVQLPGTPLTYDNIM